MITTDSSNIAINAIFVAEGSFKWNQILKDSQTLPDIELVMVYANKDTRDMYGSSTAVSSMLSKETIELFMKFLESAEKDIGSRVFKNIDVGVQSRVDSSPAEVNVGLGGK